MYVSVLDKFIELGVDMMPRPEPLASEDPSTLHALTEGIHTAEALDMVKEHVRALLGPATVARPSSQLHMSKLQAAQVRSPCGLCKPRTAPRMRAALRPVLWRWCVPQAVRPARAALAQGSLLPGRAGVCGLDHVRLLCAACGPALPAGEHDGHAARAAGGPRGPPGAPLLPGGPDGAGGGSRRGLAPAAQLARPRPALLAQHLRWPRSLDTPAAALGCPSAGQAGRRRPLLAPAVRAAAPGRPGRRLQLQPWLRRQRGHAAGQAAAGRCAAGRKRSQPPRRQRRPGE